MSFRDTLHKWQSLVATLISVVGNAVIALVVAIWVSSALTTATKRTEFFLEFTKRYQSIHAQAHELNNRTKVKNQSTSDLPEGDAHEIYFKLFSLIADEISAYQNGFLDKKDIIEWMTWQMHDYRNNQFQIGGVSYPDGWTWWLSTSAQYHSLTPTMRKIYSCEKKECVSRAIEELS